MPKQKTRAAAAKRFKLTGSGKLRREQANRKHILEKKSSKRKRRLAGTEEVSKRDVARVRRMLEG
ncbi:MAG: 50S ribosomal protein L35 [Actinomycetota bacterium]